jgi:hypothetical protein
VQKHSKTGKKFRAFTCYPSLILQVQENEQKMWKFNKI